MNIGTKSILYGAHAFWLHPFFVALAWWRVYGFPLNPRLWVAFFAHDIGYWGLPNMDGPEGEAHVFAGAEYMYRHHGHRWGEFTFAHSRFMMAQVGKPISRLCVADKYATALIPYWLYLPMVRATGEIREYKSASKHIVETGDFSKHDSWQSDKAWFLALQMNMTHFMEANAQQARQDDLQLGRGPE